MTRNLDTKTSESRILNHHQQTTDFTPPQGRFSIALKVAAVCIVLGGAGWLIAASVSSDPIDPYAEMLTAKIHRGPLTVIVREQGLLESSENHEFKSKVRGFNTVLWIIDSGTYVNEGDELVRLDALGIQEQVDERTKYANWSQSAADRSAATVERSRLAVEEYKQGRFKTELLGVQKEIAVAESILQNATDRLKHSKLLAKSGYLNDTEIEERSFAVDQAKLDLDLKRTQLEVLQNFTYEEQLQTLTGNLTSIEATHQANVERATADGSRRDRAVEELQYCVIKADRSGLVIHPNAAKWENGPIAEGTNVHKDQVLLLMPNLEKMQVKIGVHESSVKRVKVGQNAQVMIGNRMVAGEVAEVASITKPAGWWTGNQVRYDTLITLPPAENQLPGMSAEVEITVATYEDVLQIPVAAIVETEQGAFCWVKTPDGRERTKIELGDNSESFQVVKAGLAEGEEVFMNPYAFEGYAEPIQGSAKSAAVSDDDSSGEKPLKNVPANKTAEIKPAPKDTQKESSKKNSSTVPVSGIKNDTPKKPAPEK